jgi:hypothetical protein
MSNKVLFRVSPGVLTLALVAGFLSGSQQGCGSGSSSGNFQAVCDQGCDKQASCMSGFDAANCKATICTEQCSNASAMASKISQCNSMACANFLACIVTTPACQGSSTGAGGSGAGGSSVTGAGGSIGTGTGGSIGTGMGGSIGTGTGGTAGGSACAPCAKFDACCMAAGQSNCTTNTSCMALTADQQATIGATCQMELNLIAAQPTAPAACK